MLKGVEGEVRSRRPRVERPFLLLFVISTFCASINERRDISAGATDVCVWESHCCRTASIFRSFLKIGPKINIDQSVGN